MSLLVRYTLKSESDHAHQVKAMETLVEDLKSECIVGLNYSCFFTENAAEFIGVLEFDSDATKDKFLTSAAFATYRETVGSTFANPPQTTDITGIASTWF